MVGDGSHLEGFVGSGDRIPAGSLRYGRTLSGLLVQVDVHKAHSYSHLSHFRSSSLKPLGPPSPASLWRTRHVMLQMADNTSARFLLSFETLDARLQFCDLAVL